MEELFWAKVDKSGGLDACWLWMARKNAGGYGRFGKNLAHRVAWQIANGDIPDGVLVLHHCDVAACVNERHLFLGDSADNAQDKVAKGRVAPAPYLPHPSPDTIREVRRLRAAGLTVREISQRTGIREGTAWHIVWGNTFKKIV